MQFNGTRENNQQSDYTRYTGLESFQFLGINPTADQLGKWQGRDITNALTYDIKQDNKQNTVRPVVFYFQGETAGVMQLQLNIGNTPAITSTGNYQVITSTGSIVWAKPAPTQDNPNPQVKPEFANHRPLVIGEAALITLLQRLVSFDRKSNEDFFSQIQDFKLDADNLYKGNYAPYAELAKTYADSWVTMPMVVVEKDEPNNDGVVVTKLKNYLGTGQYNIDKTMFSGKVSEWAKGQLTKNLVKQRPEDNDLMQGLYTIEFMPFDKTKCLNNIPNNPSAQPQWNS